MASFDKLVTVGTDAAFLCSEIAGLNGSYVENEDKSVGYEIEVILKSGTTSTVPFFLKAGEEDEPRKILGVAFDQWNHWTHWTRNR